MTSKNKWKHQRRMDTHVTCCTIECRCLCEMHQNHKQKIHLQTRNVNKSAKRLKKDEATVHWTLCVLLRCITYGCMHAHVHVLLLFLWHGQICKIKVPTVKVSNWNQTTWTSYHLLMSNVSYALKSQPWFLRVRPLMSLTGSVFKKKRRKDSKFFSNLKQIGHLEICGSMLRVQIQS